jgi:hypothetical protein
MTKEQKQDLEAAILADLRNPHLLYIEIAARYRVGLNRVIALTKTHGLTRKRGRKPAVKG